MTANQVSASLHTSIGLAAIVVFLAALPSAWVSSEGIGQSEACKVLHMPSSDYSLLPLGDSITEGAETFVVYRELLLDQLTKAGHRVHYVGSRNKPAMAGGRPLPHQGHSGKDIGYIAGLFEEAYRTNPADIVLLHAGHNRSVEESPIPDILRHTQTIIETARSINPEVVFLVAQVIPAG